jgi:hypothetical protein
MAGAMVPIPAEPVHLIEDAETGDRFLIYGTEKGTRVELRYDGDTLWMTQAQMAELYGVDRSVVSKHLANIYEDGELELSATSAKNAQVRTEGGRSVTRQVENYNLDAVISVGYRVNSKVGTQIRKWATEKLVQFATKGFVIDVERLKNAGERDRIAELREIIRDIRSNEANLYSEIRHLFTLLRDYDPDSEACTTFYRNMQAKMVWAVTTHTPAELIISRADANHPQMGLRTWKGDRVLQADIKVSKNYLIENEVRELNRLTTIMLDVFEDQLDVGRISAMADMETVLDGQLRSLGRPVLGSGGVVKMTKAQAHATAQYQIFDQRRRENEKARADAEFSALKGELKALPKATKRGKSSKD